MDVIVLRHGIAEPLEPDTSSFEDRKRELTEKGRRRLRKAARGLARRVPKLDAIGTSSLVRAMETADIVAERYGGLKQSVVEDLEPGGAHSGVASWLAAQRPDGAVLLVGHNPGLEELVSWLLAGVSLPFLELDKGGACLLRIEGEPGPGSARLRWLLRAKMLRKLA